MLCQQPAYIMRVRVGGPGTQWQDQGSFGNGAAVAWGSSLCVHEHQAVLLPAPAGAKRVAHTLTVGSLGAYIKLPGPIRPRDVLAMVAGSTTKLA